MATAFTLIAQDAFADERDLYADDDAPPSRYIRHYATREFAERAKALFESLSGWYADIIEVEPCDHEPLFDLLAQGTLHTVAVDSNGVIRSCEIDYESVVRKSGRRPRNFREYFGDFYDEPGCVLFVTCFATSREEAESIARTKALRAHAAGWRSEAGVPSPKVQDRYWRTLEPGREQAFFLYRATFTDCWGMDSHEVRRVTRVGRRSPRKAVIVLGSGQIHNLYYWSRSYAHTERKAHRCFNAIRHAIRRGDWHFPVARERFLSALGYSLVERDRIWSL